MYRVPAVVVDIVSDQLTFEDLARWGCVHRCAMQSLHRLCFSMTSELVYGANAPFGPFSGLFALSKTLCVHCQRRRARSIDSLTWVRLCRPCTHRLFAAVDEDALDRPVSSNMWHGLPAVAIPGLLIPGPGECTRWVSVEWLRRRSIRTLAGFDNSEVAYLLVLLQMHATIRFSLCMSIAAPPGYASFGLHPSLARS